jgi:hypothetical protein
MNKSSIFDMFGADVDFFLENDSTQERRYREKSRKQLHKIIGSDRWRFILKDGACDVLSNHLDEAELRRVFPKLAAECLRVYLVPYNCYHRVDRVLETTAYGDIQDYDYDMPSDYTIHLYRPVHSR